MKQFSIKQYKTKSSAQKAAAQFKRRGKAITNIAPHIRHDKRLKPENRLCYVLGVAI